jgi:hypothetical protein
LAVALKDQCVAVVDTRLGCGSCLLVLASKVVHF